MIVSKLVGGLGLPCGMLLCVLAQTGCSSSPSTFSDLPASGKKPGAATGSETVATSVNRAAEPVTIATASANSSPLPPAASSSGELRVIDMIQPGDTLRITFADLPPTMTQQPTDERVKEDGTITLMLNKTFKAAGKTHGQLAREIRAAYVPDYFVNMTVSIQPMMQTQFYYVGGEVKEENRQVYIGRITVTKAIQSAKGFTDFARKNKVELTRGDGRKYVINCIKAQKDPTLDLEVFPGDKIWVPRRRNPFW